MTGRARFWLISHPRVGRPVAVLCWTQLLACLAVGTAPAAAGATNAVVLNWTGLHDSYGVPIGELYLSLASVRDQLIQAGPNASAVDPSSWMPWLMHAVTVMVDSFTAANILTAEVGMFVGIIALAMWVMRLTISSYWLTVLGELARAVSTAVITVTTRWGLVALTVPIGVFLGVLAVRRGERGRGVTMIMLALFMPALAVTIFSDPAGLMYGPQGLLQFGRRMAFSTAQAATDGGAISGGGFSGQVDTLTASLITHAAREPLEVFNFGHVVDNVGGCGPAVSAAWMQGSKDGPIQALARCGDTAAVHYAQNLDATNVVGGAMLVLAATAFGWFMVSAGASVFMVSVKAIYTTTKLLPSVFVGGIDGAARAHAKSTVWDYFKHPLEATVFITFVSVVGLAIERLLARPLPAELGGANPFAHVVMMAGASLVGVYLLRHIRADLNGTSTGRGLVSRAGDVAVGLGLHAALGGAGKAALGGVRGLRGQSRAAKTPWEQLDEKAAAGDAQSILGPAQEGFAPVPGLDGSGSAALRERDPSAPGTDPVSQHLGLRAGDRGPGPVMPAGTATGTAARALQRAHRRTRPPSLGQPPPVLAAAPASDGSPEAPQVAPIGGPVDALASWEGGAPSVWSYVDHTADVPIPLDPPEDLEWPVPPPPDTAGPPTTTVDPIHQPRHIRDAR
jgi:hypothetical protein